MITIVKLSGAHLTPVPVVSFFLVRTLGPHSASFKYTFINHCTCTLSIQSLKLSLCSLTAPSPFPRLYSLQSPLKLPLV